MIDKNAMALHMKVVENNSFSRAAAKAATPLCGVFFRKRMSALGRGWVKTQIFEKRW